MKSIFLTLAFIIELVAFISFAGFGYTFTISSLVKILLFVLLFLLLVTFWSIFMAPRATKKFNTPAYYVAKCMIYAVSSYTLYHLRGAIAGSIFIAATLMDEIFLFKHNVKQKDQGVPHK